MGYLDSIATASLRPGAAGATISNTWPLYDVNSPQYPSPTPYNLAQLGYRRNEIIYACIQKRASAVSEAPLRKFNGEGKDRKADEAHALRKLIKRPNSAMGEVEFWQAAQIYLDIAGFSVWEIEFSRGGDPLALWPMRPDWCSFLRGPNQPLRAVRYQPYGLPWIDVPVERLLVFMEFDPLFPMLKGLARSAVAMRIGQVDNSATDFLSVFFREGAVINGLLKTQQSLQQSEANRIRELWKAQHGGVQNWGDPAVLGSGVEYQPMQMNFKDMAFDSIDGRDESRMCTVFEVPPILIGARVGLEASTYSNYEQARRAFYEETVKPRWRWLQSEVAQQMAPHYDEEPDALQAEFDTKAVSALQEDRDAKWKRADTAWKSGWATRDEARQEADLDAIDKADVFVAGAPGVGEDVPQPAPVPPGLPGAADGPPPEQASAQFDKMVKHYAAARKLALAAVGQPVGLPFDDELKACKTAGDVRAVFERHWPRATKSRSDTQLLAEALEHAARVLEETQ